MTTPENNSSTAPEGAGKAEQTDVEKQQAFADAAREAANNEPDDDDVDDENFDADKARKVMAKKNREAQNLREELKRLRPLADEAEKRRKGEQTEAQRLTEEKAQLEVDLAELRATNTRRDAVEAAGLPAKFVKFITAAEPDEALAQAKELAKEFKAATGEERKPDLRQGARGGSSANNAGSNQTHDDLLRQMARGR